MLKVSIVVICKELSECFLNKTLQAISKQTFTNWELLVLPDKDVELSWKNTVVIPTWPKVGPSDKKDIGIKHATGEIVAFIDDDAYPDKDWLKNSIPHFANSKVAAVCGPGVTPPDDTLANQVSGWFWASPLGSGGAGTYRCWPGNKREVDDYPTFNLIARKSSLLEVGGFDSSYWPGEDTKLSHDLVYLLNKKIMYDPKVLVYHQRRPVLVSHLKQLGRYGIHRGYLSRVLPRTSRRLGYFWPSIFALGVFGGALITGVSLFVHNQLLDNLTLVFLSCLLIYFIIDILNSFWVLGKSKNPRISILLVPTTFISHVFYGCMFIKGLVKRILVSKYDRNKL